MASSQWATSGPTVPRQASIRIASCVVQSQSAAERHEELVPLVIEQVQQPGQPADPRRGGQSLGLQRRAEPLQERRLERSRAPAGASSSESRTRSCVRRSTSASTVADPRGTGPARSCHRAIRIDQQGSSRVPEEEPADKGGRRRGRARRAATTGMARP